MPTYNLSGKTILVTGASSGIGRAVAVACSFKGATLIITGRNKQRLDETAAMLNGSGHISVIADVCIPGERENLINTCPNLHGIFLSAGLVNPFPVKFINEEKYSETMDINFKSVVMLIGGLSRSQKITESASVLFMSSISTFKPHKGGAMYAASKSALEAFARVFALESAARKIRVNVISAGMVKTPMYAYSEEKATKEVMDRHAAAYPLGVGLPEDVAHAALFFLSDDSCWVTGSTLLMDGGFTLGV